MLVIFLLVSIVTEGISTGAEGVSTGTEGASCGVGALAAYAGGWSADQAANAIAHIDRMKRFMLHPWFCCALNGFAPPCFA